MPAPRHTEDTLVQATTADFLRDELGWESVYAFHRETLGPDGLLGRTSETEMVLRPRLRDALERLTPGLPAAAYDDAERVLLSAPLSAPIVSTNRTFHALLRDGVKVDVKWPSGETEPRRLRVLDFDTPENNDFLVVRELWIQGDLYRCRADLVCFVNGLPLVFIEVKNVHRSLRRAYDDNLSHYFSAIPHAFHHNAFLIVGNGEKAKVGTVGSKFEHYHEWKRLHEEDAGVVDMETLLRGLLRKDRLLDLVEHFLLFDESTGAPVKILARNHQVLGVNRAVEAVRDRKARGGKLGVFWHTQGSGKSYSMVFFAAKVRRTLGGGFTFVVVTDRDDLDGQIYKTFAGCGLVNDERETVRAASGPMVEELIRARRPFVFTLVQKFNQKVETPYTDRDDVIVMSDEAHRSQYGDLARNMRAALPQAAFIGFTGTPLFKEDEITRRYFGDYVSTYDFQRAVEDGATVPLYYDARGEKLGVALDDINERVAEVIEEAEITDQNVQERLDRELRREYHIITAEKRLRSIARDFARHYATGWETGKAMFVCLDKVTCVRMHGFIAEAWTDEIRRVEKAVTAAPDQQEALALTRQLEWMRETQMAVVISEEQGEIETMARWGVDIKPHRALLKHGFDAPGGTRMDAETAFKHPAHPFRVAIVTAMWLTGFDVPTLSTLYLDKPLRAHTLMQAIARANRVAAGKNNGLIVDYGGILRHLRQALATWASEPDAARDGTDAIDPVRPPEELIESLAEAVGAVRAFLTERNASLDALTNAKGFALIGAIVETKEAINETDESRKRFGILAREVAKKRRACGTFPEAKPYDADCAAIDILYKKLEEDREVADISDVMQRLQGVVDEAIAPTTTVIGKVGGLVAERPEYDISRIDFAKLREEFERGPAKNTAVQSLKALLEKRLARMMRQNPLRTDLQEHYEQLVAQYNADKDRLTIEQTFDELLKLAQEMTEEQQRAVNEGVDEETLALYDLLRKDTLSTPERERIKAVAVDLLRVVKDRLAQVAAWTEKDGTRAGMRQLVFDRLYDDATGLPSAYTDDEIQERSHAVLVHLVRAYPNGPVSPYYAAAA